MASSSNFNGKIFINQVPTTVMKPGAFWKTLQKVIFAPSDSVPGFPPGPFTYSPPSSVLQLTDPVTVTWLGHSTLLITIAGKRFLTDPVWAQRASPFSFAGPKRFFDIPVALDQLPPLDGVILTHDHYDHLDEKVIRQLAHGEMPFYCPLGVERHLKRWGVADHRIHLFDWWDELVISQDLTIIAAPTRHFSGRGILDRNTTLWTSYILKGKEQRIFVGGDSGFFAGFEEIGNKYGPFDLTILEIGAYNDNWPDIHLGPDNAIKAHLALKGKVMLPVHWGTFNLAPHPWTEPVERLIPVAAEKGIVLWLPAPGEGGTIPTQTQVSYWWKQGTK
jgi:L-ascorbate metabolism protein UlaG (beta-lactamase superfamily)